MNTRFSGRVLILRYNCRYCGHTFSYLPSFFSPHFQYNLEIIFSAFYVTFLNATLPTSWDVSSLA
ncbi:MAG: DUF6431 domain-containing protein [Bacillota bacterium]